MEDDLLGKASREPLRTCCMQLSRALWGVFSRGSSPRQAAIRTAVIAVQHAAGTEQAASHGQLDVALTQLLHALQPKAPANTPESAAPATRLDTIELLAATLQAAAMHATDSPAEQQVEELAENVEESLATLDTDAHDMSAALRGIAEVCGIEASDASTAAAALAAELRHKVDELMHQLPSGFFEAILPKGSLSPEQESKLQEVDAALRAEYALRRRMLCERAKVTLQSFSWSTRLAEEGAAQQAQHAREAALARMTSDPQVSCADVFSATLGDVMAVTERATSGEHGGELHTRVKEVLIGKVPDRGGRPEGRSRAADMPAWSARRVGGRGGRGGGVNKKGRGGGKSQKKQ